MNCEKFMALDPIQQSSYLGSVLHVIMSDDEAFEWGKKLISYGQVNGLFDKVKIGHEDINENETNSLVP